MELAAYLDAVTQAHNGTLPLNAEQLKAVEHGFDTPLWILAGPGTGKTHTLVWLVLKRILVDNIHPDKIVLTTFTRKAAAELESRLIVARDRLLQIGVTVLHEIDLSRILVGTLHGLCSQLLQDHRYEPTFRIRVLEDELTQQFFLRRCKNRLLKCDDIDFWVHFGLLEPGSRFAPNTAARAAGAAKLFNRMTENSVDIGALRATGQPYLILLADCYEEYKQQLADKYRTDQAHLQHHFLQFLGTPSGQAWVASGITVIVDEYQDTNPIQEQIYFALAGAHGDLTVVGDDDQSLYRFRGAIVEALVQFDRACEIYLSKTPTPIYLFENRRSHPQIVNWVNHFINQHPEMRDPHVRVRAPDKPQLVAKSSIAGNYPAVMLIEEKNNPLAAAKVARTIDELKRSGYVEDYSQIALLTFSTRETPRSIGAYTDAIRALGIQVYNPRRRTAQKDQRFQAMIGALSTLLDPDGRYSALRIAGSVRTYVDQARSAYNDLIMSPIHESLRQYVATSQNAIASSRYTTAIPYLTRKGGRQVTTSGLLYKLLAHEPFVTDITDAEGGERLKALNLILAEYESLYSDGAIRLEDNNGSIQVADYSLYTFYSVFVEGIHDGLNDPEDAEVSIQPGMVNIMTIHQAKGLEFEVVFVLRPDKQPFISDTHTLEDIFDTFSQRLTKPAARRSQELRAAEDAIRLFFVAYSRAKRLLVVAGTELAKWERVMVYTANGIPSITKAALQQEGVHIL
jgi:DNA helicase II / ATP-dependent DNA helicase PcrA